YKCIRDGIPMDRWLIIAAVLLLAAAAFNRYRYIKLKKEVLEFSEQLEKSLDFVIAGKQPQEGKQTDTLFAKLNEKLTRIWHIFELKGQENLIEKKQLQELVSDISHQCRIPLSNQNIYLDILKGRLSPEEKDETVKSLENQTIRLQFLMESMIKLSRLETGIVQIKKEEKNLSDTIRRSVSSVVPAADKKNITLSITGDSSVYIRHDVKWTIEAVTNLLDNAVKYTSENGKVEVSIRVREIFTEICVSDNGKGIRKERQAQIFKRFYREPEVHDQSGIGIGLYLTRKITEMQGGYIEVMSAPGEGAAFHLYLPV
ncbi:MAG: HAMP domain-containing histidine kinase, partial [Butyrivibrio sp.]|nr:HAMP domain-containing histidine kinase [Butyrivibrio sp.]